MKKIESTHLSARYKLLFQHRQTNLHKHNNANIHQQNKRQEYKIDHNIVTLRFNL